MKSLEIRGPESYKCLQTTDFLVYGDERYVIIDTVENGFTLFRGVQLEMRINLKYIIFRLLWMQLLT